MKKRVRIVPLKYTAALQLCLEAEIKQRYPEMKLDQLRTSLWYLELPDSYDWKQEDSDFMNGLADEQNMLAGWGYLESVRT